MNADRNRRDMVSLMSSRVGDAYLRTPFTVDGGTDIVTLCREMAERGIGDALVRDGGRLGMFTTTNLRDALLRDGPPAQVKVRDLASFPTVDVDVNDELFDSMMLMLRRRVHRLVVRDGETVVGVLSQLDLMGLVANHSHMIAREASEAADLGQLKAAALQVNDLIRVLHADGVRVEVIAGLVGELNRAVFERLWTLLAPEALRENSCLIVMGSEGRGEQIIKTDQDNGLILRDGFPMEGVAEVTTAFTAALVDFGYPPCPGGIMASNPLWCQPLSAFRETLARWVRTGEGEGPMNLAIFFDAAAVAGDARLLAEAKAHLFTLKADSDFYLMRFAQAVNNFRHRKSIWPFGKAAPPEVDIKKLGLFPIVQGTRALALQHHLTELPTTARLRRLAADGHLPADLARDLGDALRFLIGMKLDANLRQMAAGEAPDNRIDTARLGTLDRRTLDEALDVAARFQGWISRHFRLPT